MLKLSLCFRQSYSVMISIVSSMIVFAVRVVRDFYEVILVVVNKSVAGMVFLLSNNGFTRISTWTGWASPSKCLVAVSFLCKTKDFGKNKIIVCFKNDIYNFYLIHLLALLFLYWIRRSAPWRLVPSALQTMIPPLWIPLVLRGLHLEFHHCRIINSW